MTNQEFSALVARLEEEARRDPRAYERRVFGLALLGYGYLGAMLVLIAALFFAALASITLLKAAAFKIIVPIGALLWVVLRAMRVTLAAPVGRLLTRQEAPLLFGRIDELRRRLRAPRFHRVIVSDDFNAAIVQVPRIGMFGWNRNYLLLGLPLMKLMTPLQFESVLAHEIGHLAGGHGRTSNWIYRLRMRWARLLHALEEQESGASFLFTKFFDWYAPYFSAYSFPLARANEYQADAASVRAVSREAAAEALTSVSVIGAYLAESFWRGIHRQADELPRPAFAPYQTMGQRLEEKIAPEAARAWLEQAMEETTSLADTHPSLADRLKAIGETPRFAPPAAGKAADTLLGRALPSITAEFDSRWQQQILPSWEKRHQEVKQGRIRLAELDAQAATQKLPIEAAHERARLTEDCGAGADAALEQYRVLHRRAPENAVLCFALGQRLLGRDDTSGVQLVKRAMELDEEAMLPGFEALRDHFWRACRKDEAHGWHAKLVERQALLAAAKAERDAITRQDEFEAHGLPAEAVADLKRQLEGIPGLRKAYLVRKRLAHFPGSPLYVLGHAVSRWWGIHTERRAQRVQQQIADRVAFPGAALILNVEGDNRPFGRKLRAVRGSRVR